MPFTAETASEAGKASAATRNSYEYHVNKTVEALNQQSLSEAERQRLALALEAASGGQRVIIGDMALTFGAESR